MARGRRFNKEVKRIKISMKEKMLTGYKVLMWSLVKPSAHNKQKTGMKKGISRVFIETKPSRKLTKTHLNARGSYKVSLEGKEYLWKTIEDISSY